MLKKSWNSVVSVLISQLCHCTDPLYSSSEPSDSMSAHAT